MNDDSEDYRREWMRTTTDRIPKKTGRFLLYPHFLASSSATRTALYGW